jgi:N-methylhydantoinase A
VLRPLDEDAVRNAAAYFSDHDVEAVAVAFLWSMMRPDHELRAAEILRTLNPDIPVVCSHSVLPEIREWQRTSATVLSAYVLPRIGRYLRNLEQELGVRGLKRPPLIMQINGGCARVDEILERPVAILASGPAAAPAAALHYAQAIGGSAVGADAVNVITIDMGGTSLDVCVIRDGRPTMSRDIFVEEQPIGIQAVECHSIGAGGGSIAWIDDGGALRVGPRSAGADPGPCAYGRGGSEPTVTDANVVLGYLQPDAFLGGRRQLRFDLAEAAIDEHVGRPLGLETVAAAAGIVRVVNANMASAIRAMSVERGIDPRGFTLICGGGAGGLHAVQLARELGIGSVFVPAEAGAFCAFGMIVTDVRHDHVAAHHLVTSSAEIELLNRRLADLERHALRQLTEEGFADEDVVLELSVDARYPGQVHEITVPFSAQTPLHVSDLREIERRFHEEHQLQFAYRRDELPVECLHWRVTGIGRIAQTKERPSVEGGHDAPTIRTVSAYSLEDGELTETAAYRIDDLRPGAAVRGPAIVQVPTTTVVIGRRDVLRLGGDGNLTVDVAAPVSGTIPTAGAVLA